MQKQKLGLLVLGLVMFGVMAGCAKTQEVVPPVSTLETSLLPTGVPTQNPWPTAAMSLMPVNPDGDGDYHGRNRHIWGDGKPTANRQRYKMAIFMFFDRQRQACV